jgi:hypothetical protein
MNKLHFLSRFYFGVIFVIYLSCIIIYIFLYNINYLYILYYLDKFLKKMPYVLRKQKTRGYKVCKRGTRKCFSKRPLTKYMAKRQMRALYLHERVGAGGGTGGVNFFK